MASLDEITDMAFAALDALPPEFSENTKDIVLQVVDWPPIDLLRDLGIEDPLDLTGLYDGVPLTEKSSLDPQSAPDLIWLFREPILQEWRDRGTVTLSELVTHVVVHEVAHHFGWSDADIARIDQWWT